ncbi:hypothetical protein SAMN06296386_103239 [Lachnospiraceae bacterium]|nr:hypothetical protein SAMN06296386_103239 [Lachnospiraceae bacterium]
MTATLIEKNKDFNIVGVCDRYDEKIGDKIFGLPILSQQEAEHLADVVVINTAPTYWNTIFTRIADWKVPVYYKNGQRAILENRNYKEDEYWNVCEKDLNKKIQDADIISFDVFGTLVKRIYSNDIDLFRLVEEKIVDEISFDFVNMRKQASVLAGKNATLVEIYDHLRGLTHIDSEDIEKLIKLEFEVDYSYMVPRKNRFNF